ncbi:hypothetical protein M4V62_37605 [Streptomyces durmitorensis]|uniref:Uncharacterized protein n=1 Tax=Streptomyces durmitorensis TaxID=319947 RepID=A0ABY4Q5B7_9ACTN|nr:hypothetical protein [Streptomyces durmitorensis]UQT60324.1 hypothetical protein M4V62_37605 [Streptomyces durmitorensis]
MPIPRVISRVALVSACALLAGCGTQGSRSADPETSGSRSGGAAAQRAWAYEYVSDVDSVGSQVLDIAAVSRHEAWAMAALGDPGGSGPRTRMLRFDGSRWQRYDLDSDLRDALGGGTLSPVSLHAGVGSAWLFGRVHHGPGTSPTAVAARFDGNRWVAVEPPRASQVTGVAVLGASDVWVLGQPEQRTAWHWDGHGWTATQLPVEAHAITPETAGGDLRVAGNVPDPKADKADEADPDHPKPRPLRLGAARWDGRQWRAESMPDVETADARFRGCRTQVRTLVARGAEDVWAMGIEYGPYTGPRYAPVGDRPCALHWDGERWGTSRSLPAGVLDAKRVRGADGKVSRIARPPYVAGTTGKVTGVDRKQSFRLAEIVPVPGTDEAWGVGSAELGAFGEANFSRAVIVRHRP